MGKDNSRLRALPDDILLNILDRLDVRDAARTSILSRRWSQLAPKLSRLVINAQDFAPQGVSRANVTHDHLVRMNEAAVEATRSILARRNPGERTIRLLSTAFYLRDDAPISIGLAAGHAMATHLVEMAKFSVMTEKAGLNNLSDDDVVTHGKEFMRFFNACPNAFGGLTSLDIENLRFGESDISNVLITCKRLKRLRLFNCDSGEPSTLQVEHSHLTELSIVGCLFEQVKLNWLPRLTQMVFDEWLDFQDPLVVGHVPLLEAVSLTNIGRTFHKMVKLSEFLSRIVTIRDLKLGFQSEKIWVQPECPTGSLASLFRQLRFVNLADVPEGYDLTWTMFILEAAPLLKELYMTVWDHTCLMVTDEEERKKDLYSDNKGVVEWQSSAGFQHHSLATLVIFGFASEDYLVSYVRRVMEAAVNLEDVFLYSRMELECYTCPDKPVRFPWTKRQRILLKKRITMGIESFAIIHSSAKLRADHLAKIGYPACSLFEEKKW